MVADGSVYIFPALIPYYTQVLGMSYVEAGLAWTVINLVGSLPQPFLGVIADRLKSYSMAGIGLLISVVAVGPVGFTTDPATILALALIAAIGIALVHPVGAAFTSAASGERRGLAMSMFSLGGSLGFSLAPLAIPPLILLFGPPISATLVPAGLLVALPLLIASSRQKQLKPIPRRTDASVARSSLPLLPVAMIVAVCVLRSWVYTALVTFLPIYLTSRGFSLTSGAQILALAVFMTAVGSVAGGALADRFSPKWGSILSLAACAMLLAIFFVTSGLVSLVVLSLAGLFLWWSYPVTVVMAQKLLPANQALASGLTIGLGIGLGSLGVALTGWFADLFGMAFAMTSLSVVAFIAAIVLLPYRERQAVAGLKKHPTPAGA